MYIRPKLNGVVLTANGKRRGRPPKIRTEADLMRRREYEMMGLNTGGSFEKKRPSLLPSPPPKPTPRQLGPDGKPLPVSVLRSRILVLFHIEISQSGTDIPMPNMT